MKRKATVVGVNGDEPSLFPGERGMLSSRMTEQENPLCFQLDAHKTRQDTQPSVLDYGVYFLHLCLLTLAVHFFPLAASGALSVMPLHPFFPSSRSP